MWALITLWQLVPLLPFSYVFGLGFSPEARTLFASGALLIIAAAYAVDRLPLRVRPLRLAAFAAVVVVAWLLASFDLQPTNELVGRDELLVLILVVGVTPFALAAGRSAVHASRVAILLIALLPIVAVWGLFNPLQSTRVMFRKPDTDITRELDALAASRPDGAIAVSGIDRAVLNGVGYRSVTHVIATPSPHLFRKYFPDMGERKFNAIFNRYAQIWLTTEEEPHTTQSRKFGCPSRRWLTTPRRGNPRDASGGGSSRGHGAPKKVDDLARRRPGREDLGDAERLELVGVVSAGSCRRRRRARRRRRSRAARRRSAARASCARRRGSRSRPRRRPPGSRSRRSAPASGGGRCRSPPCRRRAAPGR